MYYEQVVLNRFSPEIPLCSSKLNRSQSYVAPPPTQLRYKRVGDFVADLARAGRSFTEIKKKHGSCLGGPELEIFAMTHQGARHWAHHLILKETVRTVIFIASVAAALADERGLTPGLFLLPMEYRICR
jgi:hypothetical protein